MAGSSVTVTREGRDIGGIRDKEVILTLALVSDDTNGLVPAKTIYGMQDYELIEAKPIPDATAPFTAAWEILVQDENDATLLLSGSIATDSVAPIPGHNTLGYYPKMDGEFDFKLVDPADHSSAIDVGNSKEATVILRFLLK